jgi:hypothetical protein
MAWHGVTRLGSAGRGGARQAGLSVVLFTITDMTTDTPSIVRPFETVDVPEAGPNDEHFFSVTTILKALSSPALEYWAIRMCAMEAIDKQPTWQAMLEDSGRTETIKWLCGARYRRPKLELGADQLGTVVHRVCEEYALTGRKPTREWVTGLVQSHAAPTVDLDAEVNVVGRMLNQFDNWLQRFTPEYTAAEMPVYNEQFGYAGSLDAILTIGGVRLLTDYKRLARDTPLATPTGWTTVGSIQEGDQVFGTDGHPITVIGKSAVMTNDCYRVTFDDTSSIVCDGGHLWAVQSGYPFHPAHHGAVLTTDELRRELCSRVTGQHHWQVLMPEPLQLPPADLPIDPYVYGCWLGDGTQTAGVISKPDDELFELIRGRGYHVGAPIGNRRMTRTIYGLARQLKDADLFGHRVVPQIYLRGSIGQRLDLLRGLMDTDGSWNTTRHQAVFSTVDKATADTVYELVVSLGERPLINSAVAHGFGKDVTVYQLTWRPRRHNPFSLPRKADKTVLSEGRSWRRLIVSIEPTVAVPTQCIATDAVDHCFLAGTQLVPTHNTRREPLTSQGKVQTPYGETALQLAAYRHAELGAVFRARRYEKQRRRYYLLSNDEREMGVPVPQVDGGACLILTPESAEMYPMRCDQEIFDFFLYCFEAWRWQEDVSKRVVGDALVPSQDIR